MTILVVDDERNIADSIAGTLIAELNTDAEVHVCYGSQQAKDFSATHYIDIIVCDIDMPKCNGISLCKSLLTSYPDLKIIFLTGHSDFSYAYEALKFPEASYVLKLEDDAVLLKAVHEKIGEAEKQRRRESELAFQVRLNDELSAEVNGMKLRRSVEENGEEYSGRLFLFMIFSEAKTDMANILRNTFGKDVAVFCKENVWFAAIPVSENANVAIERAKRLQQDIFERDGNYSVFAVDLPRGEKDGIRYSRLESLCGGNKNGCRFIGDGQEAKNVSEECGDEIIESVKKYIDTHLGDDLSLTTLASAVYYNPAYLSRKFKAVVGENLHSYILGQRMRFAERLLVESDDFVLNIAKKCGFANPAQFGIVFAKLHGCAPMAYRRKNT